MSSEKKYTYDVECFKCKHKYKIDKTFNQTELRCKFCGAEIKDTLPNHLTEEQFVDLNNEFNP